MNTIEAYELITIYERSDERLRLRYVVEGRSIYGGTMSASEARVAVSVVDNLGGGSFHITRVNP